MNPFVILKRNKIRLCIYMLLFFSNASCGQNRIVISDKEQDSVVLYDVQGLKQGNSVNSLLGISGDCQMPDSFLEKRLWKST